MPEVFEEDMLVPPKVRKTPAKWPGENFDGVPYDQCPVNFLRFLCGNQLIAGKIAKEQNTTFPDKTTGEPVAAAPLRFREAALANAWAERLEEQQASERSQEQAADQDVADETEDAEGY